MTDEEYQEMLEKLEEENEAYISDPEFRALINALNGAIEGYKQFLKLEAEYKAKQQKGESTSEN